MNRFHFFDENVMWQAENSEKTLDELSFGTNATKG